MTTLIAINAGSSSLKAALFEWQDGRPCRLHAARIERLGQAPVLREGDSATPLDEDLTTPEGAAVLIGHLGTALGGGVPDAIAHRVVHGGDHHEPGCVLTEDELARLSAFSAFAPLHQAPALEAAARLMEAYPDSLHVGCFDTAFHARLPEAASVLPLPAELREQGLRRMGYHGLSYQFISTWLKKRYPALHRGRVVAAHLGSGASLCAMRAGRSLATTMSLTPLDGVPMGTRSGSLDPGLLLYLLRYKDYDAASLEDLLYRKSGLLGLSGFSGDMRDLLGDPSADAELAVEHFVIRVAESTASLTTHLGGIDALVFTGGIGANDPVTRGMILHRTQHLDIPEVLVVETDEERVMAEIGGAFMKSDLETRS